MGEVGRGADAMVIFTEHSAYFDVKASILKELTGKNNRLFQSNTPLACCGMRQHNFD